MTYLIECPRCQAFMGAEVKADAIDPPEDWIPVSCRVSLCVCPGCSSVIIGLEHENFGGGFEKPERIWPSPPIYLSYQIPEQIRLSLLEADKCLKAQAYTASIAMSGRALEAIGRHFYPQGSESDTPLMLKQAIDKLAEDQIIDGRLHKWGLALHRDRNLAAHPSGTDFKEEDAKDVFKFVLNICDYIFVLSAAFEEFEKRRKAKAKPKSSKT